MIGFFAEQDFAFLQRSCFGPSGLLSSLTANNTTEGSAEVIAWFDGFQGLRNRFAKPFRPASQEKHSRATDDRVSASWIGSSFAENRPLGGQTRNQSLEKRCCLGRERRIVPVL